MHEFAQDLGQRIEKSIPYNQYQDGVAERVIRLVIERARMAMIDQEILAFLWPEITSVIVHVTNRTATSTLQDVMPWQFVIDQVYLDEAPHMPDVSYFRVLGCKAYVLIKKEQQVKSNKIAPRTEIGILVGYESHNIWRMYLPGCHGTKVVCSSHVRFDERGVVTEPFPAGSSMPETRSKGETVQDFHNHDKETNEPVQPISEISFDKDQQPQP
jgi:hypothetical protein